MTEFNFNLISPSEINTPERLKKLVPSKILRTGTIDFTGDGIEDFLCKTEKIVSNGKLIEEYWITSEYEIVRKKEIKTEYDYKWFINLDNDREPELIKAQGESEGINYGIYKLNFSWENDSLLFYFNPVIEIDNKYYWGYPWEIKNIRMERNNNKKIKVALKHDIIRDGAILELKYQKVLPAIIFTGESKKELEVKNLRNIQFREIENLRNELFGSRQFLYKNCMSGRGC